VTHRPDHGGGAATSSGRAWKRRASWTLKKGWWFGGDRQSHGELVAVTADEAVIICLYRGGKLGVVWRVIR